MVHSEHFSQRWVLHAGDAYFFYGEVQADHPHCPPGLRPFQRKAQASQRPRRHNQQRLAELVRSEQSVTVFSAHDQPELAELRRVAQA